MNCRRVRPGLVREQIREKTKSLSKLATKAADLAGFWYDTRQGMTAEQKRRVRQHKALKTRMSSIETEITELREMLR